MKKFALAALALIIITATWISLGWIAILVIPAIALFALLTFAPLIVDWAQINEPASLPNNRATPC